MWIKQVVCDGFKSYAHRTIIGPFDREFNAITGLNGSGKSNILDAICFVFAISNLSKVRVRDLRELIYKSGQAGITKASVTIEFDNTGPQKPLGYSQELIVVTRQVILGGRNKFFVNGKSAQLSQVQTLFHSVQLNVNNPHFLIMQGTITKVINQRPQDTLLMLQEAAGTRMYELKKQQAQHQIERKEVKVAEIDRQLEEDITPTLQKLADERQALDQHIQLAREIEILARLKLAYDYEHTIELAEKGAEEQVRLKERAEALRAEAKELATQETSLARELEELKRSSELANGLAIAQREHDESKKSLVSCQAALKNHEKEEAQLTKGIATLEKELRTAEDGMKNHAATVQKTKDDAEALEKKHSGLEDRIAKSEQQLQLLKQGVQATTDGVSVTERIDSLKKGRIECSGSIKRLEQQIAQRETRLASHRKKSQHSDTSYVQLQKRLAEEEKFEEEKARVLKESTGGFDPGAARELEERLRQASRQYAQAEREVLKYEAVVKTKVTVPWASAMPSDLNDRKVKGRLALFVTVGEKKHCVPLSVASQRALQDIVVDNEETGKKVIGAVKERVTVIPLNRIRAQRLPAEVCEKAAEVARAEGGSADLALELVSYPADVSAAVTHAYGTKFICSDLKAALPVAFHPNIRSQCVTMDGEVVNPGGEMSGGSMKNLDQQLLHLHVWKEKRAQLQELKREKAVLEAEQRKCAVQQERFQGLQDELSEQHQKVEELKYALESHQQHQVRKEVAGMEEAQGKATAELEETRSRLADVERELSDLEEKRKQGGSTEQQRKSVEQDIAKSRQQVKEVHKRLEELRRRVADDDAGESMLQDEIARITEDRSGMATKRKEVRGTLNAKREEMDRLQQLCTGKAREMRKAKLEFEAAAGDIQSKEAQLSTSREKRADLESDAQKAQLKSRDVEKDTAARKRRVEELEKSDFVKQNRAKFGTRGSDLDWRSIDHVKEFDRLEKLKASHAKSAKTVNQKVLSMYESVESRYNDVREKRRQIAADKEQVKKTIKELEEQKRKTILDTYEKVTVDFSSIFGTLLPGANAKLHADQDASTGEITGIGIKVAMGQIWKEGLTELSGGQRSLLALSLILALLKYKPAPVYILDEVDAALDLSHTQNIGKMLKNHFRNSQFLVVSLKEGMFNNANVLFKVRLADGQSQVSRIASAETARQSRGHRQGDKRRREEDDA
eukprot:TRINITY_DN1962_c0_g2_i1.p1 TRINITY_DN1962_c0_g2~~TRINITY_DN1962_c0_g2_i1.p1  ORF type:complete len:1195 (+),score=535.99 TRINITY_DN1962_c0_g2_i1:63-3647(+)